MPAQDPTERILIARMGGFARAARYSGRDSTQSARTAFLKSFEEQVDPSGATRSRTHPTRQSRHAGSHGPSSAEVSTGSAEGGRLMNGESAPKGASADSRSEVESHSTATGGQGTQTRLFDPTRYSPVSVAVWMRLPESNARAFGIGFALGTMLDAAGTSAPVRNGKQISCSVIRRERLPAVLEALGKLNPRQWRRYVGDWVARYVAHKCAPGVVCLFRLPNLSECPACKAEIPVDHVPEPAHKPRGPGFGRFTSTHADVLRPLSGTRTSAPSVQERPRLSTTAPHRKTGINGMAVGTEGPQSSEESVDLPEVPHQEGSSEISRSRTIDEWPQHFEGKSCPECGCWPHQGGHFDGCSRRDVRSAR